MSGIYFVDKMINNILIGTFGGINGCCFIVNETVLLVNIFLLSW